MSKNAILYNPRTLLGGATISIPIGILSRRIRHSTRVSLQQKAQPLYVSAKVKIIFQTHNIFKQKNTKSLAKTKNNTYLCQYKKTKPQITLNYYITTIYTLL